jgi:AcrR family transcriptional regulator
MKRPREGLTEARIVEAAMSLLAEHGVDGLSMRVLSDRLGVALGATYRHVPNKHALLQLVARNLYAGICGVQEESDSLAQVKAVMLEVRRIFGNYPGMAAYMSAHMSEFESPEVVTMLVDPLLKAGLRPADVEVLMISLVLFTAGHLLVHLDPVFEAQAQAAFEKGLDLLLAGALALSRQHR